MDSNMKELSVRMPIDLVGADVTPDDLIPYAVEIELPDGGTDDAFLKVRETLSRIGIANRSNGEQKLYQTCNILHKQGRYFIVHFKMMFMFDGRNNHLTVDDIARQNTVIKLLDQWGLIRPINPTQCDHPVAPIRSLKVVKYADRDNWSFLPKYKMGVDRG